MEKKSSSASVSTYISKLILHTVCIMVTINAELKIMVCYRSFFNHIQHVAEQILIW